MLLSEGLTNKEAAARLDCRVATVSKWRGRFQRGRLNGLADAPRSGHPPRYGPDIERRRWVELLAFMNQVIAQHGNRQIHVILDNLNTRKPKHDRWLQRHRNAHFHYTPTHAPGSTKSKSGSPSSAAMPRRAPALPRRQKCASPSTATLRCTMPMQNHSNGAKLSLSPPPPNHGTRT